MMRCWGARHDTVVCDEPLYAHYLLSTGITYHPGRQQILESHPSDLPAVIDWLTGPAPEGAAIFYQKHMAHHLLPGMPLDWTTRLTNVLLVRDPREMLLSLTRVIAAPTVEETGLPQQVQLLQREQQRTGHTPPVIDARDVLQDPPGMLRELCRGVDVAYDPAMLHWAPGPRDTDGVWGEHWYHNVWQSTTFEPYRPREGELPPAARAILPECQALYDQLIAHKLTPLASDHPTPPSTGQADNAAEV